MAYMNQEMKKEIHANLKKIMPKGWKFSTAVDNLSTIVLNIWSADVDLCLLAFENSPESQYQGFFSPYHLRTDRYFKSNLEIQELFREIVKILNLNNYDNSDSMIDYFDVGHYVEINIGKYNKPFIFNNPDATKVD